MSRILLTVFLLAISFHSYAASGTWQSKLLGTELHYTTTISQKQVKDESGKRMTIIYLENLACEKIGQNSNADDVKWLLDEGYSVVEIDYAHNAKAVSPDINLDIVAINDAVNTGRFASLTDISTTRTYVLFEGYRIRRDVVYYTDDPSLYNWPGDYTTGDPMMMDIVYPANPSRPVPTVLSFSYSNSYHGKPNQRMFLGYTLAMFDDSLLEGLPGAGMAWAIADHPKYCDWGQGKPANGANKDYKSIELNPDAARKVKAAVRTLRHNGQELGLANDVALYGFSRGSTAASLGIGNAPFDEWLTGGDYLDENSDIQAAILGPGVFDYALMGKSTTEFVAMQKYCGTYSADNKMWAQQGGALAIGTSACPCFLFYNSSDDAYYDTQMRNLMSLLDSRNVSYQLLKDYGTGHSVPTKPAELKLIYDFLSKTFGIGTADGIKAIQAEEHAKPSMQHPLSAASRAVFTLSGQPCGGDLATMNAGIYIVDGHKIVKTNKIIE